MAEVDFENTNPLSRYNRGMLLEKIHALPRNNSGRFLEKMHWGKFLAPALFLAPESMGAVVGACPTTPKNGFARLVRTRETLGVSLTLPSCGQSPRYALRTVYVFSLRAVNQCPHLLRKIGKVARIAPQICQTKFAPKAQ